MTMLQNQLDANGKVMNPSQYDENEKYVKHNY